MNQIDLEIILDALSCLREYQQYGETMRKIGRGFHPTGRHGHSIENVIHNLDRLAHKVWEEQDSDAIPVLQEVTRLAYKLDKKVWED